MMIKIILLLITLINGQNMNIINSFLFHPRKSCQNISDKDFKINVGDNVQVGARFHLISKSVPTLLFFHGDAGNLESRI